MSADSPRPGADGGHVRRVSAVAIAVAVAAFAALSALPGDSRSSGERAPYASAFPDGPGRAIAERACLFCHSPMLVTQQAKDSTGWEKTLTTMRTWGTPITAAEQDTLRGYLLTRFGPRPQAR